MGKTEAQVLIGGIGKKEKAVTGLLMHSLKLYSDGVEGAETGQRSGGTRHGVSAALRVTPRS